MKFSYGDDARTGHAEFVVKWAKRFPETLETIYKTLDFEPSKVDEMIMSFTEFDVPVPLTVERAKFMIKLLLYRQENLKSLIKSEV